VAQAFSGGLRPLEACLLHDTLDPTPRGGAGYRPQGQVTGLTLTLPAQIKHQVQLVDQPRRHRHSAVGGAFRLALSIRLAFF